MVPSFAGQPPIYVDPHGRVFPGQRGPGSGHGGGASVTVIARQQVFVEKTQNIYVTILTPPCRDDYSIGRVRCCSYSHWWSPPIIAPVLLMGGSASAPRNGKPSDATRTFAVVLGAVVGGFAIYKVGQMFADLRDSNAEIREAEDFLAEVKQLDPSDYRKEGLKAITEKRLEIFKRIRDNSVTNLILTIGLVVAAVLAIVGGIMGSYLVLGIALVAVLGVGGGLLLKWGFNSNDKKAKLDAEQLQHLYTKHPEVYSYA